MMFFEGYLHESVYVAYVMLCLELLIYIIVIKKPTENDDRLRKLYLDNNYKEVKEINFSQDYIRD